MIRMPRELVIRCCKQYAARDANAGMWVGTGVPDCIQEALKKHVSHIDDISQYAVLESVISHLAIALVAAEL